MPRSRQGTRCNFQKPSWKKPSWNWGKEIGNRPGNFFKRPKGCSGGYGEEFFPDEFRHLLEKKENPPEPKSGHEEFLERYLEMIESLYPSETQSEIFNKMLTSTSRLFGAERSGLFWFPSGKYLSHPELRAACNLTQREVKAESFKKSLDLIRKAFRTGQPLIGRTSSDETAESSSRCALPCASPLKSTGKLMECSITTILIWRTPLTFPIRPS